MGFTVEEWGRMSPWQTTAMTVGYIKAHAQAEQGEKFLPEAEADDIWTWMQDRNAGKPHLLH